MSEAFIGEVRLFPYFTPQGWLECDGSLLSIAQYDVLYSIIGTTYGGDGSTNFGLPDLRGRASLGAGNGPGLTPTIPGETKGSEGVTLTQPQIPSHTHGVQAVANAFSASGGDSAAPVSGASWPERIVDVTDPNAPKLAKAYSAQNAPHPTTPTQMSANAIASAGGSQPHENRQPYLAVRFAIAYEGIYPQRS